MTDISRCRVTVWRSVLLWDSWSYRCSSWRCRELRVMNALMLMSNNSLSVCSSLCSLLILVAGCVLLTCCFSMEYTCIYVHLRSDARHQLTIPRHRLSTYGRQAFAVAGPMTFNTLPTDLRDLLSAQQLSDNCWKHTFSLPISTFSALGVSHVMRYINLRYLLTYLLIHLLGLHF